MKRKLKSALSLLLCMIMVFGALAAGGEGIGELFSSGKAEAAELSISQTDVFKKYPQYLYNPYASKLELNCLTASLDALTSYSKADSNLASFLTAVKDGMSITIRMFSSMLKIQASLEDQYLKDSAMQFLKTVNGSETVLSQSVSIVDNVWKPIKESWGAASAVISYNDQIKESAKLLEKATKMGSSNAAGVAKAIVEKSNEQSVVKTIGSCVKAVDESLLAAKTVAMMTELYAIDCKMIETIMANVPKNSEIYKGLNLVLQDRYKSPLNYLTNEYFTQKAMKQVGSYIGKALKEGNSLYGPVSAVVSLAAFVASNYIWKGQTAEDYIKACHMTSFASEIGHVVSDYKNKFVNKTYTDADIDSFKTLYSAYIMALKASANLSYAAAKSKQQKNAIYPFCTIMGNNLTYDKYIDSCIINIKADIKDGKLDTSGNFTSVASEQNTKSIAERIEKVMQKYPVGSIVDEESFSFIRKVFSLIYDCEMPIGLNAYRLERRDNVELLGSITKNDLSESGVKALLSKAKKGDIIVGWNQYKANGMLVLGVGETGITVYDCDSHIGGEYVKGKVSSRLISYSALAEGFKKSNDEQMFTPGFSLYRALVCGRISTGMGTNLEYATYDDSVNYVISDGVLTGYNGKRSVLDIPEGVTQIADNCFKNRTSITSVNMPESLISIGQSAFEGCSNLRSVNFNDALDSIGNYAFSSCSRLVSAVFGSKLETIGSGCFYNCYSLCSVLLPEIIESIAYSAFEGCTSLESIVIPDSVTRIVSSAFSGCTSLASVTLSRSLESMGAEAFAYCTALTSIEIPKSLDEVTTSSYLRGAFFKCSNLNNVTFEEGTTEIASFLFAGCDGLSEITIPDTVTIIENFAFYKCENLQKIIFPDSVTEISYSAFEGCTSLESIVIPDSVTEISSSAFAGCTSLESVVIPDSVTWIGGSAFSNCTSLASVTLSKSLESMGAEAFAYCTALTSIEIPKSLDEVTTSSYLRGAFFKCSNLNNVTFEEGTTEIASFLFAGCDGLSEITIPDTVTIIENFAFYKCENLQKIIFPDSVTEISYSAFEGCTSLESIVIPDSVTEISSSAFAGCTSLESVVIPDSVTWIGGSAFSNCTSLASVTLSKSLESMGAEAFAYCTALTSIEIPKSLDEVTTSSYLRGAFFKCSNLNKVTFEEGTTEIASFLFAGCDGLSEITIPDTVTIIENFAFYKCENLQKIIFPDSVTEISYSAFEGCTSLESIVIPLSVSSVENQAFNGCSALKSAEFKNPNTKIGERVFSNCSSLASVKLPENLTSIPEYTFNGCKLLADINLPATLRSIGNYAFYNCDALTELTVPGNVWQIGSYAFYDCDSITKAVIPDSVTSLGSYAFYSCDKLAEIDFGIGLTAIPDSAFRQIPALTKVILPRFATTVAANAFAEDTKLREVTIPSTVTSIQTNSFSYPTKLTVYGIAGSYAEQHAKERKMTFVAVDGTKVDSIAFKQSVYEFSASGSGSYFIPEMEILPKESVEPITFTSSDESIAAVNNGKVTFKGYGTATITATTASGKTAACTVKINRAVSGVRLDYSKLSLKTGETAALTATVYPSNAANKAVKWISSAPDIASVDQTGKITALKPGITTVTVETVDGGYTATCNVTVIDSSIVSVTGVKLSATVAELTIGNSKQLTAAIAPTNATNKGVTWSSSNTNVASVSSSGVVVAKGEGTATITVRTDDGGYTAACTIRVSKPSPSVVAVTGVKLSAIGIELPVGGSKRLSATITPSNATNKGVTWISDNTSVATVNSSGLITAKGEGTATVTVRSDDGGYTATCKITVVPVTAPEKVEISVSADSLKYKETTRVNVSELPVGYTVQYSSSDESIAKVDSNGNIKAVGKGTATITVKVIDPNGNVARDSSGKEISDSVQMNCTMTFWQRIVKWFKNLFGIADTSLKALGLIVAD